MFIYTTDYYQLIKTFQTSVITVAALAIVSIFATGLLQAASAVSDNANLVGQTVSKDGFSGNQNYMQSCKQSSSASDCAKNPTAGNGPFTSNLAQSVNGPN